MKRTGRGGSFPKGRGRWGVPEGRLWNRLNGSEVEVGAERIRPSQVLGEKRPGRRIGISGDTRPSDELKRFFGGCDYLVFDATFMDDLADRARETGHSTAAGGR